MWQQFLALCDELNPEALKNIFVAVVGFIGGLVSTLMGEHLYLLQWLTGFLATDYVMGVVAAARSGMWSSRAGIVGLLKKFVIILIAIGFHGLGQILDLQIIGAWAIGALAINELISILEHIEKAGLGSVIPQRVRNMLEVVQEHQDKTIKDKFPGAQK